MFEGIVKGLGTVKYIQDKKNLRTMIIYLGGLVKVKEGDSVSVNGTCLTVTKSESNTASFDIIQETLNKTNLGSLEEGDKVNLEGSLAYGNEINGHLVQGHVESVAKILERQAVGDDVRMWFKLPSELKNSIIPKGCIAVDGISLTVADIKDGRFSVALIPETLKRTTLGFKKKGHTVNLETDALMRSLLSQVKTSFLERIYDLEKRIEKLEGK